LVTAALGSIFAAQQQAQLASEKAAETEEATKQRDEARQNAYFADIRQAHQDLNNGQMRRMLTTLRDYVPTVPAKDVRGWEWYYLLSQAHQDAVTMTDFDGVVTQTEWSADGKRLFTLGTDETLRIWNPDGSLLRKIVVPGLTQFALSPDSTQIVAVSGDPVIRFFDAESCKLVRTIKHGNDPLIAVDWHPKGEMVALVRVSPDSRHLFIVETKEEQIVWKHRDPVIGATWAKFSPVGDRLLVAGSGFSNAVVFQLKTKGVEKAAIQRLTTEWINSIGRLVAHSHQPLSIAWHPDGRKFAVGAFRQGVRVFEVDEESETAALVAHFQNPGSVDAATFSSDGEQLVVGNRAQRIDIYELESKQRIESLAGHLSSLRSVAEDPTGKLIASSSDDGSIKVWHRTDPPAIKKPQVQNGSGTSPDGRFSWQQQGRRVDIRDRSGKQVAELEGLGEYELTSRFFPKVNRCLFWAPLGAQGPPWICVYDTQTWELEYKMKSNSIAFPWASIVGDFAVMSIPRDVERFNGRTGKVDRLKPHPTGEAVMVALSPKGEWLATACQGEVKL
ncbi:MAG: WD40 repeat domain-containing protein, partial [Planctomycetales bacterium]|nr:WD40 repeat domain-containing protein [Planctomycetales bacterium]